MYLVSLVNDCRRLNLLFFHHSTGKELGSLSVSAARGSYPPSQIRTRGETGASGSSEVHEHWCLVRLGRKHNHSFSCVVKSHPTALKGCFSIKREWGTTLWRLNATTVLVPFRELLVLSLGTFPVGWRQCELWDWETELALGTGLRLLLKSKRSAE